MPYKAVIFDLDGTLLNTLEDIGLSMNRVLEKNGYPVHKLNDYRYFVGEGAKVLVEKVLPDIAATTENVALVFKDFETDYSVNWKDRTKPYPGIMDLLSELKSRDIKIAILSNKIHEITIESVSHFFPRNLFEVVLGQRDQVPKKPDPTGAFEIAAALDIPVSDFVYVGDTAIDMKTANAAAMYPVGVLWGFRPESELSANGAGMLIDNPMMLLSLF